MKLNYYLGDDKSVEVLINAGADVTIKNINGKTPRDLAPFFGKIFLPN